jgi:hypothetical protein
MTSAGDRDRPSRNAAVGFRSFRLAPLTEFALGAIDAVMHRKQLRGIKQRPERRSALSDRKGGNHS